MPSTQDVARDQLDGLPVLVVAAGQTEGRGRSGAQWQTADRALAASLAVSIDDGDDRPFSLMAGVAATRVTNRTSLKWPNDLLFGGLKVGGILVERSGGVAVIGLGLNLWWPAAPDGMGALFADDPGEQRHAELGGLWGAEVMEMLGSDDWPIDAYRDACETLGREITWEPDGAGRAVDVADNGALIVEIDGRRELLYSGAVHHVRPHS